MKYAIVGLILVLFLTVGCNPNIENVQEKVNQKMEEVESNMISISKDEYDSLQNGIKGVVELYGRIDDGQFDIRATKPVSMSVCKQGCHYFMYCDTHSMAPTFTCNDSLFGYKPSKEELVIGDIVGYQDPNESMVFIHRIIGIENETYIMKGDNNLQSDPYQPKFEEIKFKIVRIEYK